MKIIDKKKDYYDFLVGKWGVDEKCVYVRNGIDIPAFIEYNVKSCSYGVNAELGKMLWKIFRKEPLITPSYMRVGKEIPEYDDTELPKWFNPLSTYTCMWLERDWREDRLHTQEYGNSHINCVNLVVGNERYYFEVLRYLKKDGTLYYDMLYEKRELFGRMSIEPIYFDFGACSREAMNRRLNNIESAVEKDISKNIVVNPLLKSTFIPSIIPPETIWIDVENYISGLNNDKVEDKMTNKEKILSHGFDLKTSFRKM